MALKFLKQVFQDINGAYSFKRMMCAVFVALFVGVSVGEHFLKAEATYLNQVLSYTTDILKWLFGFIVAERAEVFGKKADASIPVK